MQTASTEFVPLLALVPPTSRSPFDRDAPTAPMYLSSRPKSAFATDAITNLASSIIELKGSRKTASDEYRLALGAMVAELVRAASYNPPLGCFRPLRAGDFPSGGIGYTPFKRALEDMKRHGYASTIDGEPAWRDRLGTVTRVFVTPKLTDHLATHGITVADRDRHFQYSPAMDDIPPIQLRASSKKPWFNDGRGKLIDVAMSDPAVSTFADQIGRLNEYLHQQCIVGPGGERMDIALYRGFNLGDEPGHGYKKGGRVYAAYQGIKRKDRNLITINDQPTVEVDISACFLTLVHYLLGRPFFSDSDPYAGPSPHRDIVKAWVNLTIGYSAYHKRWPPEAIKKLEENGHMNVKERYPMATTKEEILKYLPIISDWVDSGYTWADLFFIESEIMIDAVERLALVHDIPALPIHDGIRVPVENTSLVKNVISESFIRLTGIIPLIK